MIYISSTKVLLLLQLISARRKEKQSYQSMVQLDCFVRSLQILNQLLEISFSIFLAWQGSPQVRWWNIIRSQFAANFYSIDFNVFNTQLMLYERQRPNETLQITREQIGLALLAQVKFGFERLALSNPKRNVWLSLDFYAKVYCVLANKSNNLCAWKVRVVFKISWVCWYLQSQ